MGEGDGLEDIEEPAGPVTPPSSAQVVHGPPILPQHRILLYSADEWEDFVQEWTFYCVQPRYAKVQRFGGARDRGIDVAAFTDDKRLQGVWDNYQCKHYDHPLEPGDIWPEIVKVLWNSFNGAYLPPRKYYFAAPKGVTTTVAGYLNDAPRLKAELIKVWDEKGKISISRKQSIELTGDFRAYVEAFDFSIFDLKTGLELVEAHRGSPYHAARFGGALPTRPPAQQPPAEVAPTESRYVTELLRAYGDHKKSTVEKTAALSAWPTLASHFKRQREAFYNAESLRVFARDTVPPGTFEGLQEDIFQGVVDVHDAEHADGYARVCEVTRAARELQITENALLTVTKPRDRDGVCHQLANDERLRWTKDR